MVGAAGEHIAAWWLSGHGLRIAATNLEVFDGEIDILARDGATLVAVEVRTVTGSGDPIDAVNETKRARVRRLGGMLGAGRTDFVGVALGAEAVTIHWVPG